MLGLALGILKRGCQLLVNPQFKGKTQRYVVKLPKSAGAGQYCPKIPWVPGTRDTRTNSSPVWATSFAQPMETERLFILVFAILIFFIGANCIKCKR